MLSTSVRGEDTQSNIKQKESDVMK